MSIYIYIYIYIEREREREYIYILFYICTRYKYIYTCTYLSHIVYCTMYLYILYIYIIYYVLCMYVCHGAMCVRWAIWIHVAIGTSLPPSLPSTLPLPSPRHTRAEPDPPHHPLAHRPRDAQLTAGALRAAQAPQRRRPASPFSTTRTAAAAAAQAWAAQGRASRCRERRPAAAAAGSPGTRAGGYAVGDASGSEAARSESLGALLKKLHEPVASMRRRRAEELRRFIDEESRELPSEQFSLLMDNLTQRLGDMVNEPDVVAKLGCVTAIDELVDVRAAEKKHFLFFHSYVSTLLQHSVARPGPARGGGQDAWAPRPVRRQRRRAHSRG